MLHAVDVIIEALKVLKVELAESKDQPEQGYSRGGRGNASGSGEQGALQQPGLYELIAKSARPATDPRGSAGVVHTTPWPFLWESAPDCTTAPLLPLPPVAAPAATAGTAAGTAASAAAAGASAGAVSGAAVK